MNPDAGSRKKEDLDVTGPVGAALVCFGLLSFACLLQLHDGFESLSWPSTEGKVKSCQIVQRGGGHQTSIWYDFKVQGKGYSSNKYWFSLQPDTLLKSHNPALPHAGDLVPVYYCPAQPGKAVLERGVPLFALGMAFFLVSMTLLCLVGLLPILPKFLKLIVLWGLFALVLASLLVMFVCSVNGI